MKREIGITILVFLLLSTFTYNCLVAVKGESQDLGFVIRMNVTLSNKEEASNWTFTKEEKAISLFMNNTWQTVQLTNYSCPMETPPETDEDGNPLAILQFPKSELKPGENVSYTVTYHAISKPRSLPNISEENSGNLANITKDLKDKYCKAEKNWLINDADLKDLANNIAKDETNVLTIVKNFVNWISNNVDYKTHDVPLFANETFKGAGDCDDQAILLITLCRICEIPAYLQIGCIYIPTMVPSTDTYWDDRVTVVSKQIGWHGWAMVYIPPWEWLPADLTYVTAPGGLKKDPLNAIKGAAVEMPTVIQYMNISKTDYVLSSIRYKKFLENHSYYINELHEMISMTPINPWNELIWRLLPFILIAVVVPAASVTIIGIVYVTTRKKESKAVQTQTS